MNYRYLIKKLNGKKIIERTMLLQQRESVPYMEFETSRSIVSSISTQEESALLYQLSLTLYEVNHSLSSFYEDRVNYQTGDHPSIRKINRLLLDELIYIDFTGVFTLKNKIKSSNYREVAKRVFELGIIIQFEEGAEPIHFLPFHKSGSMGRQSVLSFIRAERKEMLDKRLNFELIFEDKKYSLSKLQAYQGLYLSSGMRIEDLDLDEESVIIVPDYNKEDVTEFYKTAISKSLLKEMIYSICFDDSKESNWQYFTLINMLLSVKTDERKIDERVLNSLFTNIRHKVSEAKEASAELYDDSFDYLDEHDQNQYTKIVDNLANFFGLSRLDEDEFVILDHVNLKTKTNVFDGLGFIDKSLMEQINKEKLGIQKLPFHYSVQIRLPFVKGMLHAVDLKSWYSEMGVNEIKDIFGIVHAVSKIKVILTKSQFKCFDWLYARFKNEIQNGNRSIPMKHYFEHFKKYNHALYITNTDQFESDRLQTVLNYQVLHTPALKKDDFHLLLNPGNQQYIDLMSNPQAQYDYFLQSMDFNTRFSSENIEDDSDQDILYKMLSKNPDFIFDDIFQNRIKSYANSLLKNMKIGRILIDGTVRFLSGDLLELMIRLTFGANYNPTNILLGDSFYAPSSNNHFKEGTSYAILRNPHITSRELVLSKPIEKSKNQLREKYFSHLEGIIMLNSFANQMLAMQTADTDGDLVRIIANPIYNEAVRKSNQMDSTHNHILQNDMVERLYFPSLKGIKQRPTKENLFESTVASFSTRIGIMSNFALTHSLIAYNENDPNIEKKALHKIHAEKMSFIIASEIDSVKSGKSPFYKGKSIKNPFVDYKTKIENNLKESIDFKLNDTSTNLYYLKENAEIVVKKASEIKKNTTQLTIKPIIFEFEDNENWFNGLNKALLKEVSKRMIAYRDWNKSIRYSTRDENFFESTILHTLYYILSVQYDDQMMPIILENLLVRMMNQDLNSLITAKDKLIEMEWHFFQDNDEKDAFIETYLPNIFDDNEKELIFNYANGGHKILYLILSHIIIVQQNLLEEGFKDFDSIRRYKSLLNKIIERQSLQDKIDINLLISRLLSSNITPLKLMKEMITPHISIGTTDYLEIKKYVKSLSNFINSFKKTTMDYTLSDLEDIGTMFVEYTRMLKDSSGAILPLWLVRSEIRIHVNKDLDLLFKTHTVNRNEEIKYYYALRMIDPSLNFMMMAGTNHLLPEIKMGGGLRNVK